MASRLAVHQFLEGVLGCTNVYFNPPESIAMKYPAIVYSKDAIELNHANNHQYRKFKRYSVEIIDGDPESIIGETLLEEAEMASFNSHFKAENLNHEVFTLYF